MSINLITALSNYEVEDEVVECLTAKEFQLFGRAYNGSTLLDLLTNLPLEQRVLVVVDQDLTFDVNSLNPNNQHQVAVLEIEEGYKFSNEWTIEKAYEQLRKTEANLISRQESLQKKLRASNNWIGFTGSSASPGITTIATNVAAELSLLHKTNLIDADPLRPDIELRLGLKNTTEIISLSESLNFLQLAKYLESEDRNLDETSVQLEKESITCIDLGRAPNLHQAISDRRRQGRSYIENLQQCKKLVYVLNPEPYCFGEMTAFHRQINEIYPEAQVTYVMNGVISSSRHQGLKKGFVKRVTDLGGSTKPHFIPMDVSLADRAKAKFAALNEIAPRNPMRKAHQELASYLKNSL